MRVEFYFDFSCPYACIASARIEALCARNGAELVWRPMLLGGVFRALGLPDTPARTMHPAKARHNQLDILRSAEYAGVGLAIPDSHPMQTVRALRALLAVPEAHWPAAIHALYRAYWQAGQDMTRAETVATALRAAGLGEDVIARALAAKEDPVIKDELRRRTDEAVARGVFGVPTMFVHAPGVEPAVKLWGQDRLHMVEAVLRGWRPGSGPLPAVPDQAPAAEIIDQQARGRTAPVTVHFWYDFSSPFAYLAATQIEALAARTGARLVWRPMLLGALFKELGTDNVPLLAMTEQKQRYIRRDLEHWAAYWNVPFRFPSRFPLRTVTALRLALLAGDRSAELTRALFHASWVEDQDPEDHQALARILREHGFDADEMLARTQDPAVKKALFDNTAEALAAGVFGAPTAIVEQPQGNLLFWGQDRLSLVEAAIQGWRPRGG